MNGQWKPSKWQLLGVAAYSAVFPLSIALGGTVAVIGLFVTLPFLGLAYLAGGLTTWAFGTDKAYLFGATLAVFAQALIVMIIWVLIRAKTNSPK